MEEQVSSRRHEWQIALMASAPVMLGYIVLGLGYGLYTHSLGFSWWVPTLMALTIYGGSVEFVIANMLTQAFNPLTVLVITLVVGFRQFFYSIAMLGKYKGHGFQKFFQIFLTFKRAPANIGNVNSIVLLGVPNTFLLDRIVDHRDIFFCHS